jgi:amino acid transporter
LSRSAIVLIFAFTGVESALVPCGEMKNLSRTVPLAIAVGMIGITVLYLAIQIVAQGALGLVLSVATVIFAVTRRGRFVEETS